MLERTASELVTSIEALAQQELEFHVNRGAASFARRYVPVIVTTAELVAASFDPSTISLCNGSLPHDATISAIPYIRFRKSLTTRTQSSAAGSIGELHSASERSIFVVHAEKLGDFLNEFAVD
jgi:hypothetical protein